MPRVGSSVWLMLALVSALACDEPASDARAPDPPAADLEPTPELEPTPAPEPTPPPEPTPEPEPRVAFDPASVPAIRATILAIPHRKSWVACGVIHSVGVLEVEVLDVGEPRPRMLLFVSCPGDRRDEPPLEVGTTIEVTLYARRQSWSSVAGLPKDLPQRYVKSLTSTGAASESG